ncbi:hypothetical protein [Georgenia sp. SYP-B2076]|uniref:hypothetical protein n=1 Tax=Georgenia sp. SYP-B2076 TaxID=2495881 RepID=UPI000F8E6EA6|nr:hypothetical protein [Georgenia sp. SYP-B2076]
MTSSAPETVISGVPYAVTEVNGHAPGDLDEFLGLTTFVVAGRTGRQVIDGEGAAVQDAVRVHQKHSHGTGKDVRVWRVYRAPDAGFVAETC